MANPPLIDYDVLQSRFVSHWAFATDFCDKYNERYNCNLFVETSALFLAIKSAYDDVERYKLYHLEEPRAQKSNAVKRAAYLVKWMVKCVPIRASKNEDKKFAQPRVTEYLANTFFSIKMIRQHLEAELGVPFQFSNDKVYKLAYDLTFRELNGDGLLAMVQDFYDTLEIKPIIIIETT